MEGCNAERTGSVWGDGAVCRYRSPDLCAVFEKCLGYGGHLSGGVPQKSKGRQEHAHCYIHYLLRQADHIRRGGDYDFEQHRCDTYWRGIS